MVDDPMLASRLLFLRRNIWLLEQLQQMMSKMLQIDQTKKAAAMFSGEDRMRARDGISWPYLRQPPGSCSSSVKAARTALLQHRCGRQQQGSRSRGSSCRAARNSNSGSLGQRTSARWTAKAENLEAC